MSIRVYVTGRIAIEAPACAVDEAALPSRQARLAFARLAADRWRPVPRDALAAALWPDTLPRSWDAALSAVVSKLRTALAPVGIDIDTVSGTHQLRLPEDAWVDLDAAASAIDEAEGHVRAGHLPAAWGPANVAVSIADRPFLAGEDAPWIDAVRARLRDILLRGLDCLTDISRHNGEHALAVALARRTVELEPYRERGYRRLMRAHAAAGDTAEALRVFERCRRLLADDLGADPSPPTEALYVELLRGPA